VRLQPDPADPEQHDRHGTPDELGRAVEHDDGFAVKVEGQYQYGTVAGGDAHGLDQSGIGSVVAATLRLFQPALMLGMQYRIAFDEGKRQKKEYRESQQPKRKSDAGRGCARDNP